MTDEVDSGLSYKLRRNAHGFGDRFRESAANLRARIRRDAAGLRRFLEVAWTRWWFRWLSYLVGAFFVFAAIFWFMFVRGLPDAAALEDYEPAVPTMVRDVDGEPVQMFARDRRIELEYGDFTPMLVRAFLAAEDRTFFEHGGLDYPGLARAAVEGLISGETPRGTSTITQQVAKNILLTNEVTYSRKIKEAILAQRIESSLSKQQILTLYLNEIPLGRQTYGVQAAAQAYFDKDVSDLTLSEAAFLAILPKAPERYGRKPNEEAAITRRNWVLGEMERNEWITAEQRRNAAAQPLGLIDKQPRRFAPMGGYFIEEVRRQLIAAYGEDRGDNSDKLRRNSVYGGGLWVRTSLDREMQTATTEALRNGMLRYQSGKAWKRINWIDPAKGDLATQLRSSGIGLNYKDWKIAVVTEKGARAKIALADGSEGVLVSPPSTMEVGDITAVSPASGDTYYLRTVPEVSGGMIVESPNNGRVYAMQGGFDSRLTSFNRATQAERQPGSTIKPFVYAAAIDAGLTPASIIVDGTFCVYQSAELGRKCFTNYGGGRGSGPRTMRWGLEQSRNLMTVRAADEAGMDNVIKTFKNMKIGEYKPYYAFALGAGETTVEKMVNAYSMMVNHGRDLTPTVIDFVQDRHGEVIWPKNWKACKGCNMDDWDGKPMPRFQSRAKQRMNPVTAYQVVHMLEGVITRGTAVTLKSLDRPLMGKTGTTTGPKDVWFVGGSPDVVAGLYLGFDQPRNMGGYAQGGSLAAPVFKEFAAKTLPRFEVRPFVAPAGTRMVRIDRRTGRRVFGGWPGTGDDSSIIWEAFAADTEPSRSIREEEIATVEKKVIRRAAPKRRKPEASNDDDEPGNDDSGDPPVQTPEVVQPAQPKTDPQPVPKATPKAQPKVPTKTGG